MLITIWRGSSYEGWVFIFRKIHFLHKNELKWSRKKANRYTDKPGSLVEQLARGKAEAVTINPVDMLVSADTIIYASGQVRVGIVLI